MFYLLFPPAKGVRALHESKTPPDPHQPESCSQGDSRKCKSQTELDRLSGGEARSPKHDSMPLNSAIRGHVPPLIPSHTE